MGLITLELFSDRDKSRWQNFVRGSVNYTFYQDWDFLDCYSFKTDRLVRLGFFKKGRLVAVLPAGMLQEEGGIEFRAPFSASFGGLSYQTGFKLADADETVKLLLRYCRLTGIKKISISQPPQIYYRHPEESLDFIYGSHGFTAGHELSFYLSAEALEAAAATLRRNVRKAEGAGLRWLEAPDIKEIYLLLKRAKDKKGFSFSITLNDLVCLKERLGDKIKVFGVYLGDIPVAGIILYGLSEQVALGFNWAHDEEYQHLRPADFMLDHAARWVFTQSFCYFDLGLATMGGKPVWGVARFKENFRARGILRKKYTLTLP